MLLDTLNLHAIDNLYDYLYTLNKYKDDYLICAAVKDTLYGIDNDLIKALQEFGMKNITADWCGYVFLMENGNIRTDKNSGINIPLVEHVKLKCEDCQIISKAWRAGNKARIIIDEVDLALNERGLNIVVVEQKTRKLVDSVCFDFFPKTTRKCIHRLECITIPNPPKKEDFRQDVYDINDELNKIIIKYKLYEFYPGYFAWYNSKNVIRDLADKWKETDSIACIVAGSSDDKIYLDETNFLSVLTMYQKNQVDFFRCKPRKDNEGLLQFYNWQAYDFSTLSNVVWDGYSQVYVISNQGENFIGEWLRKHNIKYVSLHDIFLIHGVKGNYNTEYYNFVPDKRESRFFKDNSSTSPIQWEYYEQSKKYNSYDLAEVRSICAKKCFFLSVVLKDFLHAEEWFEKIYIENNIDNRYQEAWSSIENLLKEISVRLKNRKQRDILSIWVDHTLYEDLYMMPFVSSLKDRSIWFENIFTLTGYTWETCRGLFTGKKLIDDRTGEIRNINITNSPVLRILAQNGYRTKIFLQGFRRMFPWRYRSDLSIYAFMQTSELLWNSFCHLLESDQPGFVLIPIEETHPPYISMGLTRDNVFSELLRAPVAYEETDKQIQFYMKMLGANSTALIFSDHGGFGNGKLGQFWPRQHTFMSIYGKKYTPRKLKSLCSSIDFYKILNSIVCGNEISEEELSRDFCEIQGVPIGSVRMQVSCNGVLAQAAPAFFPIFRGYKGIVTKEYVYLHFAGGREWLSKRDKLQPRLSWYARPDDVCDAKLLPEMRKKAGVNFGNEPPDYGSRSEYYLSIQDTYEKNYAYNDIKLKLINSLVVPMPNESVAIYCGNVASREAYLALSLENRKKVACIIDNTDDCVCSDLDLSIVPLDKTTAYGISNIIVTGRTLPSELKEFLMNQGRGIHAVGLYGWFEVNGYHTKFNFYDFAIQSMDTPLSSPTTIPDLLHYSSLNGYYNIAVVVIVKNEETLLSILHDILKQTALGITIYCMDLTNKVSDLARDYQNIYSSIEVIPVDGYSSLPSKLNELISSVNSKYLFFLAADEYLHAKGLFYLHEIAEETEADVVAAGAVLKAEKKVGPSLADFAEGAFELKKEARVLPATFKERSAELNEEEIPDFAGNKLYRVDFLRKYGIRFQDIKSGWKDIFCFQTIFGAPKYVKAVSPVCISSGNTAGFVSEDNSAEYAKKLVESMFAYQQSIEAMLKQWRGFGNNPSLCDAFRERAMTIFDQQYFSGIALDDEIRKAVSQAVQEELQNNPSIGMWWIKYLFMRSSFPQNV